MLLLLEIPYLKNYIQKGRDFTPINHFRNILRKSKFERDLNMSSKKATFRQKKILCKLSLSGSENLRMEAGSGGGVLGWECHHVCATVELAPYVYSTVKVIKKILSLLLPATP
jgi:hypothetical protein